MKNYLIILLTGMLFCSCGKKSCGGKRGITYQFDLPVTISPAKDTFHVGDTIWIENTFSDNIYNQDNSKTYRVANFDFKTAWTITDLNTPAPSTTYLNPVIVDYIGSTANNTVGPSQALKVKYRYENGMYSYKTAFVPQKPGIYLIGFYSYIDNTQVDITQCPNEDIRLHYAMNNKGDNNFKMLQYAKDSYYSNYTQERFNNEGSYCFYIK